MSNTFKVEINKSDTNTRIPARMLGTITEIKILIFEAPSTVAASTMSCNSEVRNEDWMMITANPRYCQTNIRISQYVAVLGLVTKVRGESTPSDFRKVLNTPRFGSYIHDQIVPVTMKDIATGYRISVRTYP